jgi:hypothetical protein
MESYMRSNLAHFYRLFGEFSDKLYALGVSDEDCEDIMTKLTSIMICGYGVGYARACFQNNINFDVEDVKKILEEFGEKLENSIDWKKLQ